MEFLPEYVLQALIVVGGAALLYTVAEAEALGAIIFRRLHTWQVNKGRD